MENRIGNETRASGNEDLTERVQKTSFGNFLFILQSLVLIQTGFLFRKFPFHALRRNESKKNIDKINTFDVLQWNRRLRATVDDVTGGMSGRVLRQPLERHLEQPTNTTTALFAIKTKSENLNLPADYSIVASPCFFCISV